SLNHSASFGASTGTTNAYAHNASIGGQQQAATGTTDAFAANTATTASDTHNHAVTNNFATNTTASHSLTATDNYAHSSTTSDTLALTYMGPTTIGSAVGQNIAVDGSTINSTKTDTLSLAGSSESSASGVNIVNAVGSMVANGVNINYTSGLATSPIAVTQSNTISQAH